jgi:hypothetical protein
MYGIQFEYQPGSERSNPALVGCVVHSLIPIVDSDLKVAPICPVFNRNGIHNVGNFVRAGGK